MYIDKDKLLRDIMAIDFTIIDMHLYLNTHPYDQKALNIYNDAVRRARELKQMYERMYGPLTAHMATSGYPWQWVEEPWPWEKEVL